MSPVNECAACGKTIFAIPETAGIKLHPLATNCKCRKGSDRELVNGCATVRHFEEVQFSAPLSFLYIYVYNYSAS